jgi:hypothetical protein
MNMVSREKNRRIGEKKMICLLLFFV